MKKLLFILCVVVLAACKSGKPTEPFSITNVAKTADGAKMDIQLKARLSKQQMLDIAGNIRDDSTQYAGLELNFLLPGNSYKNTGGIIVYAIAGYPKPGIVTAKDTVRDYNNKPLNFEFLGFTPEAAQHLLSLAPEQMVGKLVLGKFIDDAAGSISIIYDDRKEDQYYILELDGNGKVLSATQPMAVTLHGVQKLVVSPRGDFMTFKDSILTMYNIDEPNKPFRTIKEGI